MSMEIVMEEAPVGGPQAKGIVENAVKNAQGQFRVESQGCAGEQDQKAS